MQEVKLNAAQFAERADKLRSKLSKPLMIILGKMSDIKDVTLNSALFYYLLGYEFTETIIVLSSLPFAITTPKKALLLRQISPMQILVRNKDGSNFDELIGKLSEEYGVVDIDNCKGEFCDTVINRVNTVDKTKEVLDILAIKEPYELTNIQRCGTAASYLLQKGIDMIRDMDFTKDNLENFMNDKIRDINPEFLEYSFDPEYSFDFETNSSYLRLGLRYYVYCTEIARPFLCDTTTYYNTQNFVISIIKPGKNTVEIIEEAKQYIAEKGYSHTLELYTVGLLERERNFSEGFTLERSMCFVINIDNRFANTFILESVPVQVTKKDTPEDYKRERMRFRNKANDANLQRELKEHQKLLLDELIEERLEYHKDHLNDKKKNTNTTHSIAIYEKDSQVPRSEDVYLDWERWYVIVPILSYSVPFHITTIKNVLVSGGGHDMRLRINFKTSRSQTESEAQNDEECDTVLKSVSVRAKYPEELVTKINEMRKEYGKPLSSGSIQGQLRELKKRYALPDVFMRADHKSSNKKVKNNLEIHENGIKYGDTEVLFSNVKNVFFQEGSLGKRALIHFNLIEPVMVAGKRTFNLQFYSQFTMSFHDTSRRDNDRFEIARQEEDEALIARINAEFGEFVAVLERHANIHVQTPEFAFLGVHAKEAVNVAVSSECIVAIEEQPFFILNFSDVEVVNFERITPATKTFDSVFVFRDKTKPVAVINSIEKTTLSYMKMLIDSHNIVFMETAVSINWPNILQTILADPVKFYETDGWSVLLRNEEDDGYYSGDDDDTVSESISESSDGEDDTVSDDSGSMVAESEEVEDNDSMEGSYVTEDDTVSDDSEPRSKRSKNK